MQPGSNAAGQPHDSTFVETARRQQIARSAIETIAEGGLAKASFARIAAHAGVSPALISYHFKSRDELLRTVAETISASMDAFVSERTQHATTYGEALRALIEDIVRFFVSRPVEMAVLREMRLAVEGSAAGQLSREAREQGIAELAQFFRDGQRQGEFRRFAVRPVAVSLMAALEAAPAEFAAHPETGAARYARELARAFELAVRKT